MQSVHLCLPTVSIQLMVVISIVTVSGGFMSSKNMCAPAMWPSHARF